MQRGRRLAVTFVAAPIVGLLGAGAAWGFRKLIAIVHNAFLYGDFSWIYDTTQHAAPSIWGWGIILVPALGALLVGLLTRYVAPETRGNGVPEVMAALAFKGGRMRSRIVAIKALASALTIGTGGSAGREGPIIQISSAFGSLLARVTRLDDEDCELLVAAGGAAGIAATFNTPLGGILFSVELMLRQISSRALVIISLAVIAGTSLSRHLMGIDPAFAIPFENLGDPDLLSLANWAHVFVMGIGFGLLATLMIRANYGVEDLLKKLPGWPLLHHVVAMLLVGVVIALMYQWTGHYYVQGIGYSTIQDILTGLLTRPEFLLLLVGLKVLVTALTLGSGASGGIFSPALFIGACAGAAYAAFIGDIFPGYDLSIAAGAMVGMAAVVSAVTGALLTAIVMIFELTRDYYVILPVIAGAALANRTCRLLCPDTLYTLKLKRRGEELPPRRWC